MIELFLSDEDIQKARNTVGSHIQNIELNKQYIFRPNNFGFIKVHRADFSFDTMSFKYKNQVFSILVELKYYGETCNYLNDTDKEDFIKICKQNNLVPCVSPVDVVSQKEPAKGRQFFVCNPSNWNLFHAETGELIDPIKYEADEHQDMSQYEMTHFGIQVMCETLIKENNEILFWSDYPGCVPNIIYRKEGTQNINWMLIYAKNTDKPENIDGNDYNRMYPSLIVPDNKTHQFLLNHKDGSLIRFAIKNIGREDLEHFYKFDTKGYRLK